MGVIEQYGIAEEIKSLLHFFLNIHSHTEISNFRLKDSIIKIEDLVDYAIELGHNGVSLTDHESVSGHIKILKYVKQLKKLREDLKKVIIAEKKYKDKSRNKKATEELIRQDVETYDEVQKKRKLLEKMTNDFKLILGNEIYLVDSLEEVKDNYVSGETKFWHFILLAKNAKGHEQLRAISSSAWDNHFRHGRMERVPTIKSKMEEIIGDEKGNLIATTACLGSEFAKLILDYAHEPTNENKIKIHRFVTWCIGVFGKENFFIELQPTKSVPYAEILESHPQIIANITAVKIAKAYGLKYIVATDAHYLKENHRMVHEAYLKADEDHSSDRELGDFYETTYLMSPEELYKWLSSHLDHEDCVAAITNTQHIHKQIEEYDLCHSVIVPRDKIPKFKLRHLFKKWYNKYKYLNLFAHSKDEQDKYFLHLCEIGMKEKKQEFNEENIARINQEMEEVWEASERIDMKIAPYYVLVKKIVDIMWRVSYVGVARGSVTGFYTAYLMGITQMNPIKWGLPHWRHLSQFRPELPDIDLDSEASKRHLIFDLLKEEFGFDNVLNIMTLKTEGSKSSVLTGCRGLGIDVDTAQAISDLIPFERGSNWSLNDCLNGNKEKGRAPVTEFVKEVDKHDGLREIILGIDGLICGRSIHASGVYIFQNGYLPQNSRMRAPNGDYITAWNMEDSDYCGGLKVDCLTIKALDKIHTNVNLLIEYGKIQDQGSIRATYDKYIHPDVLDYKTEEMWQMLSDNSLIDAFQFDTDVGSQAVKKVRSKNLIELATANSLMRLMAEGEEQPVDVYVRYKENINLWYEEMRVFGLSEIEIKILEKHLLPVYGVADTQEIVMELSMDEKIAGFDVVLSNKLRKCIAKKQEKAIKKMYNKFMKYGKKQRTSDKLLHYVWDIQIKRQLGWIRPTVWRHTVANVVNL